MTNIPNTDAFRLPKLDRYQINVPNGGHLSISISDLSSVLIKIPINSET